MVVAMVGDKRAGRWVLVVEDDADIREALVELLLVEGYEVHGSPNGAEAFQWLQAHALGGDAMVLLDIRMPVMGGLEFLTKLRAEPAFENIGVLVFTASTGDAHQLLHQPAVRGLLRKPSSSQDILATIDACWGQLHPSSVNC
jgi:CheY-like chemotaxis protein